MSSDSRPHPKSHFQLRLFGGVRLVRGGEPLAGRVTQRRQLAVLAVLGSAGEVGMSREALCGLLWPDEPEVRAGRHLSDALYTIRTDLGENAVQVTGRTLHLDRTTVWCDVTEFWRLLEAGAAERAVDLYTAPFLDGFYGTRSQPFEEWVENERRVLATACGDALEGMAGEAEATGDPSLAAKRWRALLSRDPYNSRAALRLMRMLVASGDPGNALLEYERHERRVREDLGVPPSAELVAYAERVRQGEVRVEVPSYGDAVPSPSPPSERFATVQRSEHVDAGGRARAPRSWRIGAVLVGAALTMVAVSGYWLGHRAPQFAVSNLRQVTRAPEIEISPAISPDGREVVYSARVGREWHVFVTDLEGGRPVPVTRDWPTGIQDAPRWMPDGRGIVFQQGDRTAATSHFVPSVSAAAEAIVDGRVWDVRNGRVLFSRGGTDLYVRALGGGEETLLTHGFQTVHSATWSPDGSKLAYVWGNEEWATAGNVGNVSASSIWVAAADGSGPVRISDSTSMNLSPAWLPDGRHLIFISDRDGMRDIYVARLDAAGRPRGGPLRVSTGLRPQWISVSADGSTVAYALFTMRQNIWEITLPDSGSVSISEARPVSIGNQVVEHHGISRDGRWLAFDANIEGNEDIYVISVDGGEPRRLTSHPAADYHPDVSPDGSEIVFYSTRYGSRDLFLMSSDGSHEVRLTDSPSEETHPSFSPDGLRIAFTRRDVARPVFQRQFVMGRDSIGGEWSEPRPLEPTARQRCLYGRWSPDGTRLSCWGNGRLWIVSLEGERRLVVDGESAGLLGGGPAPWPEWSADGHTLFFQAADSSHEGGLYAIPVDGGGIRKVVRFDDPTKNVVFSHTIANGKVYFTLSEIESDIWVLDLQW